MDHFNLFNQHFGPTAGDDCLKQIATILQKSIRRPADFIARYGGEEFTIILPETHLKGAVIVAENIRQRIESLRINIDSYTTFYKLTVSIGVGTVIPMRNMSSEVFLQAVYRALQEAKREGRNRVKKLDVWFGGYY
jgi:diguanylate cyclase (GGDEF)-like protein